MTERLKNQSYKDIAMLGPSTQLKDTRAYQELVGIGEKKEKHKLIERALLNRFRQVPDDIKNKLGQINDTERLDSIFDSIFVINKIDQLYQYL